MAEEIRRELGAQNKSRAELRRELEVRGYRISSATLTRRLSGKYPLSVDDVEAIASVLNLSLSHFIERTNA